MIKLTKIEKLVLKGVSADGANMEILPREQLEVILLHLQSLELIEICYIHGILHTARLTNKGKKLLLENPKLRNPIDWHLIIAITTLIISLFTAIMSVAYK